MKTLRRTIAPLAALLLATVLCGAQVVITSLLQREGKLNWTNSTSATNYTYRIEWASKVDGPWQDFSALTNLSHFQTTNSQGAASVPTFFRLVWVDPPKPLGRYDFAAYDAAGQLIVTGSLSINALQNRTVAGVSDLRSAGVSTDTAIQAFTGVKEFGGIVSTNAESFTLNLNTRAADNEVRFNGRLTNSTFGGFWVHQAPGSSQGTFTATKLP